MSARRRVLVTGGAGFVGRATLPALLRLGYEVHVASRRGEGPAGIAAHKVDLTAAGEAARLVADLRPERILHLAWFVDPRTYGSSPENWKWRDASIALARAALANGAVRFVGVGTCAEYDRGKEPQRPRREDDPLRGLSPYGAAKIETFRELTGIFADSRASFAWARLFHLYGDHEAPERLAPRARAAAAQGQILKIAEPLAVRDFSDVADVGEQLARLLASDVSGPLNIASGAPRTVGEMATRFAGRASALDLTSPVGKGDILVADIGRARAAGVWLPPKAGSLASLDMAVREDPNDADLWTRHGEALVATGRLDEALESFARSIALRPHHAPTRALRARALADRGRAAEALADAARALAHDPDQFEAWLVRARSLCTLGRPEEARISAERALALRPGDARARTSRADALLALHRPAEAVADYDLALAAGAGSLNIWNNRGVALRELQQPARALESFERGLALQPNAAALHRNRGAALRDLGRRDAALEAMSRALALQPGHADGWVARGNLLWDLARPEEAKEDFDRAVALRPGFVDALHNAATIRLSLGEFAAGWPGYETRWRVPGAEAPHLPDIFPPWRGEPLAGKRIVVVQEQGLGDVLQFARFLPVLARQGAEVWFLAHRRLFRVLAPLADRVRFVDALPEGVAFDFQCPLLSLPAGLKLRESDLGAGVPYLCAEPERAALWRSRIGADGFRMGVVWQGNPAAAVDPGRSIPLAAFAPLAALPGVRVISLQKTHGLDQIVALPKSFPLETLPAPFDEDGDAFVDTAAILEGLDLVVTSDTSLAHLAGAMGRPVWLALQQIPHWRWMWGREDSPWYPTMRLFRQRTRGDWSELFDRMAREIAARPR